MLNPIEIKFKLDKTIKRALTTELMIKSHDINVIEFHISFDGLELTTGHTVKVLSVFNDSQSQTNVNCDIVDGKAIYRPDTSIISQYEYAQNYVYLYHGDKSLDVRLFTYIVDSSEIDKTAIKVKTVYDQSYAELLTEFEARLQDYKDSLPQASDLIAEVDVILNKFKVDSQNAIGYLGEVSTAAENAEAERKEAELLREENYNQKIDTAIVEADVVEKVDNKVTELTPKITELTAQLAHTGDQLIHSVRSGKNTLPKLISFVADDGRIGELDLGQVFIDNNVPLNGCIITDNATRASNGERTDVMSWEQILELQNNHGFEFGSHTKSITTNPSNLVDANLTKEQLESELSESKRVLEAKLGKPCNFLVYPQGSHDLEVRNAARKYYKASIDIDGGVNEPPITMHPLFRSNADGVSLSTLQREVDNLMASDSGWLIFMIHTTFDRNGDYSKYDALLKYINSKNIDVVTISEGLNHYENKIDLGDFTKVITGTGWRRENQTPHFMVDALGDVYGDKFDLSTRLNFEGTDISLSKQPSEYGRNTITYENVSDVRASSEGFPTGAGGSLLTYTIRNLVYSFQVYYPIRGGIYMRGTNAGTTWGNFNNPTVSSEKLSLTISDTDVNVPARSTIDIDVSVPIKVRASVTGNPKYKLPDGVICDISVVQPNSIKFRFMNVTDTAKNIYGTMLQWELVKFIT